MTRSKLKRLAWSTLLLLISSTLPVLGQAETPKSPSPQIASPSPALEKALAANPATSPYRIRLEARKGRVVMKGRVGTTAVHDIAIKTAIDLGVPVIDELVTDTREIERAGASTPIYGPLLSSSPVDANSYLYPEPLFGRVDEPFSGMEGPVISYPTDWAAVNARRPLILNQAVDLAPPPLPPNTVEMSIDPRGVAVLRGNVPTLADRVKVGEELSQIPGISNIINLLSTQDAPARPRNRPLDDNPPPPPTPQPPISSKPRAAQPPGQPIVPETRPLNPLETRVSRALERVGALRGVSLRVKSSDGGIVSLSGRVAGVKEAMLAFRAVQTTPGVSAVVDSLEFPAPEGGKRNPLTIDTDPEDVEPYLIAQLSRHLGELAHVDRLVVTNDRVEIKATLDRDGDRARAEAILRSLPLLRGFKIESTFKVRP